MGFVKTPEEVKRIEAVLQRPRFVGAEMLMINLAQFASRRHGSRMLPDSLGRSGRWITSGFGTGFRMWTI